MPEEENEVQDDRVRAAESENLVSELFFGTAEKTIAQSPLVAKSQMSPYNPDDLYQKTGDYKIYEDMETDDQVDVALQLKLDLILGAGWSIVPQDTGQEKMVQDITDRLLNDVDLDIDQDFSTQVESLARSSYTKGFGLGEKIFKLRSDNTLSWRELKVTHPQSWLIHTNEKGRVSKYEQWTNGGRNLIINPDSLLHLRNKPQYQNPYGRSDLRSAFDAWFVKRQITKYFAIFLEKYASPIPKASYKPGQANPAKVNEMLTILKRFQTKTCIVYPDNFDLDFLEHSGDGKSYVMGINLFNMFIGRSLLVPDLLGFSGSESQSGGSQALGRAQVAMFFKHIMRRRQAIEWSINRHIINPMIVWNYGNVKNMPRWELNPISDDDAVTYAKTFLEAVKGKVYEPNDEEINHFRNLIKFPTGEVNHPEPPKPLMGQVPGQNPEDDDDKPGDREGADKGNPENEDANDQRNFKKKTPNRILITGWPGSGKTTLAKKLANELGFKHICTDPQSKCDFGVEGMPDSLEWSENSKFVSDHFLGKENTIIEGVAIPRALRKWRESNQGKDAPADQLIVLKSEHKPLDGRQKGMGKGVDKVLEEIKDWVSPILEIRG